MILSPITKKQIEDKFGKPLRYPSDYEALSMDMQEITGCPISVNTLKRLMGVIDSVKEPRLYTLDTVAKYLGYSDWDVYIETLMGTGDSDFGEDDGCIEEKDLNVGTQVEFRYHPGRSVVVEKESERQFTVLRSEGSKLKAGDHLEIGTFRLHYPLISKRVVREGEDLGSFTAGKINGLTSIKILG